MAKKPAETDKPAGEELAPGIVATEGGIVHIDPDIVYPAILKALKLEGPLDQYKIETAYQCAKLEVMRLIADSKHNPSPRPLRMFITADGKRKEKWALKNHPKGKGAEAASAGYEAREHYRRWRGFIPG